MSLYRILCLALLNCYPKAYRQEHRAEIVSVMQERLAARWRSRGVGAGIGFAGKEISALLAALARIWAAKLFRGPVSFPIVRRNRWSTDLGHALRNLRRHPWHTTTVIVTLTLGIGATTAIFSVVNGVLLRPLAYESPEQLGLIWNRFPSLGNERTWVHDLQLEALREETHGFARLAAMQMVSGRILGGPRPVHTDVARVSSEFFGVLGVRPILGRTFDETDDDFGARWVAVLSHDFWTREFNQDSTIIGRKLVIGFPAMEVVGVLPPDFDHRMYEALGDLVVPQIWIPHQVNYDLPGEVEPGAGIAVLARLGTDESLDQVRQELGQLARQHSDRFFDGTQLAYEFVPLQQDIVRGVRPSLLALLGSVGFVMLIAIANVTTLVLGKAQTRTHEFAIRRAVGASTWRVLRVLIAESAVPAVIGTALGLWFSIWGADSLFATFAVDMPRSAAAGFDIRLAVCVSILALMATVIPAIAPALHVRRTDSKLLLQNRGNRLTPARQLYRAQGTLVVFQIVISFVLLVGATLAGRSFLHMRGMDPGFDQEGVITFSVFLMQEYETAQQRDDFFFALERRISQLPNVTAVGATTALPLSAPSYGPVFKTQQQPIAYKTWPGQGVEAPTISVDSDDWLTADINAARPGYFAAAGIDIVAGREFIQQDGLLTPDNPPNVVIDVQLARSFWGQHDAIGKRLWVFNTWVTVIGVAKHAYHHQYGQTGRPQLYIPYAGVGSTKRTSVVVRTNTAPTQLLPSIRTQVHAIDSMVPIAEVETLADRVKRSTANDRFLMTLMMGFAALALVLAATGIYGALAMTVANRRNEIAVRVTLGAAKSRIAALIAVRAAKLVVVGGSIGLVTALLIGSSTDPLFFGVRHNDLFSLRLAILGVLATTAMAAWWPIRRATSVDPQITLKSDGA